jgi:hypothetical protein
MSGSPGTKGGTPVAAIDVEVLQVAPPRARSLSPDDQVNRALVLYERRGIRWYPVRAAVWFVRAEDASAVALSSAPPGVPIVIIVIVRNDNSRKHPP